jgi:hypothetical protein
MREIVDVRMDRQVAQLRAEAFREVGRTNIKVHHEKVYAEAVWRKVFVIVADVPPKGPEEEPDLTPQPRRRKKVVR